MLEHCRGKRIHHTFSLLMSRVKLQYNITVRVKTQICVRVKIKVSVRVEEASDEMNMR